MEGTNEIKTKRLLLRRHRMDDALILYKKFGSDAEMYRYSGWNPYKTQDMAEHTVQQFINSYSKPDFYGWAVEYQNNLIGTVGAYDYDSERREIEIGLSIERHSWGKGFATEILMAVLKYLTEHEKIETVTAWCASDNIGSMKAMQKAGMEQVNTVIKALTVNGNQYDKLIFRYPVC